MKELREPLKTLIKKTSSQICRETFYPVVGVVTDHSPEQLLASRNDLFSLRRVSRLGDSVGSIEDE